MKTKLRGLTLATVLLSASSVGLADENGPSTIGDLPGYGEEAYFAEEATYAPGAEIAVGAQSPITFVGDDLDAEGTAHVGDQPVEQSYLTKPSQFAPVGLTELQQVGHRMGKIRGCDDGCDGGCDGGCDSQGKIRSRMRSLLGLDCNTWASTELLLWFAQDRDAPALVTSNTPGNLPTLPAATVLFGDDINGELSGGFRGDFGRYITNDIGLGGRFWILAENNDSIYVADNGAGQSLGRPFFNTNSNLEDAVLVALTGAFSGEIFAESELEMMGLESYARVRMGCNKNASVEFLGGYSHFEIDDTLRMSSVSVANGTLQTTILNDLIETENRFDGGQLGFEMVIKRGKWTAKSLTKVHLGNMEQSVRIAGSSSVQTAPAPAAVFNNGLLAMGNQGTYERDVFAFVPEANFKLAYNVCSGVDLSIGYSFLYFDNVALSGDLIDRNIDGSTVASNTPGTRPAFTFDDTSLWVQGIDLGLIWNF